MIQSTPSKIHWNYFLALERDMEVVSRFIEFSDLNFDVYSIELAHLLFAASSEVDVVAKLICRNLDSQAPRSNINDYRAVLTAGISDINTQEILIPRYGLTLTPWDTWATSTNPQWWHSYNNVKHQRDAHFSEATLKHALDSLAGLLVLTFHLYRISLSVDGRPLSNKDTTRKLLPESVLMQFPSDYYYSGLIVT